MAMVSERPAPFSVFARRSSLLDRHRRSFDKLAQLQQITGINIAIGTSKTAATKVKAAPKATAAAASPKGGNLSKPVTPSPQLAAIVGDMPLPRSEIVSLMWVYIKEHKLQDATNRRQINTDAKLEAIFGKKHVTMFEMNKHIAAHVK